jgi:hypothetical protein
MRHFPKPFILAKTKLVQMAIKVLKLNLILHRKH